MTTLATNLASAQFAAKIDQLSTKSDTLKQQISDAGNLKSLMLSLSSALGTRVRSGDLSPQPQIADGAVASGTLSGTSTPSGTFSLEVDALAQNQVLTSPAYPAASSTVGSGTLTLRFGAVAGGSFTQDASHAPVSVTIPAGAKLSDVATAINAAGAGVTAYVANGTSGAQLVLKGAQGANNGFVLDAAEDPADPGLANLAWSPASSGSRLIQTASDAALKVDGVAVSAASNTVTDAVPGVTLHLTGTNAGAPTSVSFSDASSAISSAMSDLTDALNQVASALKTATDPQTGDLARDSGARALRSALSGLAGKTIMPNAAAGAPSTLADLGLTLQRDGSFTLDTQRLSQTLAQDLDGAAAMFTNGLYGVFGTIDSLTRATTDPANPASLAGSITTYTAQQTKVSDQQTKLSAQEDAVRIRLVTQFAAADSNVGTSKSTLSFLQDQIAAWNAKSSN
jgi:flagellar hook-associated protein 2